MEDVADKLLALSAVAFGPARTAQLLHVANTANARKRRVEVSQGLLIIKFTVKDAALVHGQVKAGGWRQEAGRHAQELQEGLDELELKTRAGKSDQRLSNIIKQHLQARGDAAVRLGSCHGSLALYTDVLVPVSQSKVSFNRQQLGLLQNTKNQEAPQAP